MKPQILSPHSDLAGLIKCYWVLESPRAQTPVRNTIVPDGHIKLIFHYGAPYKHYKERGESMTLPRCFLIGQLTRPYEVEPMGETGTFFVCFHHNGFLPFAPFPIKEMENTAIPLEELFGHAGRKIGQQIIEADSTEQRIALIEVFLREQLAGSKAIDQLVEATVETILTANGQVSIEELSRQNQVNRRQLVRKFASDIGLSPKQLSKTIRLQATLKALLSTEGASLTHVAHQNEYYDQAHFIKDFKEFTGLTPKEFYGEHLKMSLIFDQPE